MKKRTKEEIAQITEEIQRLCDKGLCSREIALELRVNQKYVQKMFVKMNIRKAFSRGGPKGFSNGNYKGGRRTDKHGYVYVRAVDHPFATSTGYVFEHRLVMEKVLGRWLLPTEVVHHLDGDKSNNEPSNLELFSSNSEHLRVELSGKCPKWTPEGYARMLEAAARKKKIQ